MLRPVRRLTVALLGLSVALSGCGGGTVGYRAGRTTSSRPSARRTQAKDYQRLCDELLAPKLVEEVERVGLPVRGRAASRGWGEVRSPELTIGRIEVDGDNATAEVRTAAAGELPSRDKLELVRFGDGWRIASLK